MKAPGREIRVCAVELHDEPGPAAVLETLLSRAERERAARFRIARDRIRYVVAHGTLRRILAREVGRPAAELTFVQGPQGKPALAPGQSADPIHFSLSRSGTLALVAVARQGEVGVDVERVRPLPDVLAIARRMFAPEEYQVLLALPEPERLAVFLRYWVRKEAVVKAIGGGLSIPLQRFVLSPEPGEALEAVRLDGEVPGSLWVRTLPPPLPGYAAAVAGTFPPASIRCERWAETSAYPSCGSI